ncbi:MAG TPA: CSLREA domain-containing protein [Pyrinomonadaceae bacterium]
MKSFARFAGDRSVRSLPLAGILPSTRMFTRTLRRVSIVLVMALVGLGSNFWISALAQDEDVTPPSVEINQAEEQADPTNTEPIQFIVNFSEPVVGFGTGDVTLGGTAGATTAEVFDSGDQTTYFVVVSGMTKNGTVIASIPAGVATDAAGNRNTASISRDNTVTYNGFAAPTTFVVTKTQDTNDNQCNADCSLREAITSANANPGADTIAFNIPASDPRRNATTGVFTITVSALLGALPPITEQVTIDGYTQGTISTPNDPSDDARPNTNPLSAGLNTRLLIELTDDAAGITNADGLNVAAGGFNSRIRGLAIYGFSTGAGVNVAANVESVGAEGVRVDGNFLGVRADGSTSASNSYGVRVTGVPRTSIGGTNAAASNLISGNGEAGVLITGVRAFGEDRNLVQNNLIGTNALGLAGLPNSESAAGVNRGGVLIIDADGVLVGGANVGNVISGNNGIGVIIAASVAGGTTGDNIVQGNLIGVATDGTTALANSGDGIEITNGQSNLVGGTAPGQGNTIRSNTANGIALIGSAVVGGESSNNTIAGNTIASNGMDGVLITAGTGNRINGNSIFSNAQQGIDLLGEGVTPNDANDADPAAGPNANNLQNFPVVSFAVRDTATGVTTITGTLDGDAQGTVYFIELYANTVCDGTNGEGQFPLGGVLTGAADANGNVSFTFQTGADVSGQVITATATNETMNDTSEFSACTSVTTAAPPPQGVPTTGQIIISEFRLRGPDPDGAGAETGALDEFIEIYNNTDSEIVVMDSSPLPPLTTNGWAIVSSDAPTTAKHVIPNGTRIPARGHYLVANTIGYSLGLYPSGNDGSTTATTAIEDGGYNVDIPDNAGVALFRTANPVFFLTPAERLDAAGFAGGGVLFAEGTPLTPTGGVTASLQHSFVRRMTTGLPQDTNNNEADFEFVEVREATSGGRRARLGAPGPENLTSPIQRNAYIKAMYIDPQCAFGSPTSACARVRTAQGANPTNAAFGTLLLRRRFFNATNEAVTRLRFRLVDITAGTPGEGGTADLRALSGGNVSVTNSQGDTLEIKGLTLEELNASTSSQPVGGGLNSSLSAGTVTLTQPLAAGNSIDVEFRIGVMQNGSFRYLVNIEALFAPPSPERDFGDSNRKSRGTKAVLGKQSN